MYKGYGGCVIQMMHRGRAIGLDEILIELYMEEHSHDRYKLTSWIIKCRFKHDKNVQRTKVEYNDSVVQE